MAAFRHFATLVGVLCFASVATADDVSQLDSEKATMIAKLCVAAEGKAKAPVQLKVDPNVEHAVGLDLKKRAVIAVPDRKLTAEVMSKVGQDIVPIGVLYLYRLTPVVIDDPLSTDRLRTFEMKPDEGKPELIIASVQLAVTRVGGRLTLLAYSQEKEPVLVTTIVESQSSSEVPLELEGAAAGEGRGILIIRMFGTHRGAITLGPLD